MVLDIDALIAAAAYLDNLEQNIQHCHQNEQRSLRRQRAETIQERELAVHCGNPSPPSVVPTSDSYLESRQHRGIVSMPNQLMREHVQKNANTGLRNSGHVASSAAPVPIPFTLPASFTTKSQSDATYFLRLHGQPSTWPGSTIYSSMPEFDDVAVKRRTVCTSSDGSGKTPHNRQLHRSLEMNRRVQLRECFESMKSILPTSENQKIRKVSNLAVLDKSIHLIQALDRTAEEYQREKQVLINKNMRLQQYLKTLKEDKFKENKSEVVATKPVLAVYECIDIADDSASSDYSTNSSSGTSTKVNEDDNSNFKCWSTTTNSEDCSNTEDGTSNECCASPCSCSDQEDVVFDVEGRDDDAKRREFAAAVEAAIASLKSSDQDQDCPDALPANDVSSNDSNIKDPEFQESFCTAEDAEVDGVLDLRTNITK